MEKLSGKVRKVGTVLANQILMPLETVLENKTIPTSQLLSHVEEGMEILQEGFTSAGSRPSVKCSAAS